MEQGCTHWWDAQVPPELQSQVLPSRPPKVEITVTHAENSVITT